MERWRVSTGPTVSGAVTDGCDECQVPGWLHQGWGPIGARREARRGSRRNGRRIRVAPGFSGSAWCQRYVRSLLYAGNMQTGRRSGAEYWMSMLKSRRFGVLLCGVRSLRLGVETGPSGDQCHLDPGVFCLTAFACAPHPHHHRRRRGG